MSEFLVIWVNFQNADLLGAVVPMDVVSEIKRASNDVRALYYKLTLSQYQSEESEGGLRWVQEGLAGSRLRRDHRRGQHDSELLMWFAQAETRMGGE